MKLSSFSGFSVIKSLIVEVSYEQFLGNWSFPNESRHGCIAVNISSDGYGWARRDLDPWKRLDGNLPSPDSLATTSIL
jgi:hypothetical protein